MPWIHLDTILQAYMKATGSLLMTKVLQSGPGTTVRVTEKRSIHWSLQSWRSPGPQWSQSKVWNLSTRIFKTSFKTFETNIESRKVKKFCRDVYHFATDSNALAECCCDKIVAASRASRFCNEANGICAELFDERSGDSLEALWGACRNWVWIECAHYLALFVDSVPY